MAAVARRFGGESMTKKRVHHHETAETIAAERELARFLQRAEDRHVKLEHRRDADAARWAGRRRALYVAGVALLVAALVAVVWIVVWSLT